MTRDRFVIRKIKKANKDESNINLTESQKLKAMPIEIEYKPEPSILPPAFDEKIQALVENINNNQSTLVTNLDKLLALKVTAGECSQNLLNCKVELNNVTSNNTSLEEDLAKCSSNVDECVEENSKYEGINLNLATENKRLSVELNEANTISNNCTITAKNTTAKLKRTEQTLIKTFTILEVTSSQVSELSKKVELATSNSSESKTQSETPSETKSANLSQTSSETASATATETPESSQTPTPWTNFLSWVSNNETPSAEITTTPNVETPSETPAPSAKQREINLSMFTEAQKKSIGNTQLKDYSPMILDNGNIQCVNLIKTSDALSSELNDILNRSSTNGVDTALKNFDAFKKPGDVTFTLSKTITSKIQDGSNISKLLSTGQTCYSNLHETLEKNNLLEILSSQKPIVIQEDLQAAITQDLFCLRLVTASSAPSFKPGNGVTKESLEVSIMTFFDETKATRDGEFTDYICPVYASGQINTDQPDIV